eukprot:1386232-Amorphochlora_amoeboformis.AAC.2
MSPTLPSDCRETRVGSQLTTGDGNSAPFLYLASLSLLLRLIHLDLLVFFAYRSVSSSSLSNKNYNPCLPPRRDTA